MTTLQESLRQAFSKYQKNRHDVIYVSYYIGHYRPHRDHYYCLYDEFIDNLGKQPISNILWLTDIEIVAHDWWLHFDLHLYEWVLFKIPRKPMQHVVPHMEQMSTTRLI